MKKLNYLPIALLSAVVLFFFKPFILDGKLPIPSDTIIGLYHPFRDLYAKDYPRGIPFKNFLVTDPVRQQYPWRLRSIDILELERFELPLWNPYSFSGTPLLANFQSAVFYPLNSLFHVLPFQNAWSILIMLQPLLAGIFLYFYLQNLRISKIASFMGGFAFAFSGFSVAWLEWNTVLHTALWLPLVLLSIDRIFYYFQDQNSKFKVQNAKLQFKVQNYYTWCFIFIFSLASSFFAGHLQTFSYLFIITQIYFFTRWVQFSRKKSIFLLFIVLNSLFIILTAVQWIPTLQFIQLSARDIDQANWQQEGWFIPWQHLIQFIAPDFFGNPTTLNYWGVWNYGEFIGYVGILPLVTALFALFFRKDKKTLFFGALFFLSLIFSLPTIFAKIPYILNIPFISTTQPTRLLFITDFSLSILSAFGLDYFMRNNKKIVYPLSFLFLVFALLWIFVLSGNQVLQLVSQENIEVARRNLILPTSIFIIISILLFILRIQRIKSNVTIMIYIIIVGITVSDLIRFGQKFTPFTNREYFFPSTKTIEFLKNQNGQFRIMTTDSRILPPNFSIIYKLQSVDGYDPLYLKRYGEVIATSERGKPDISPPFGFNRIITPHNYESKIIDLLGVKYVLSLSDLKSLKLQKVFQEGQTRVYENKNAFPRVFLLEDWLFVNNKEEAIKKIFAKENDLRKLAVIEDSSLYNKEKGLKLEFPKVTALYSFVGKTDILEYSENKVLIKTESNRYSFLVLTDSYYPAWKAKIDDDQIKIYQTDYNFRGIFVPKGKHLVEFYNTLL